MAMRNDRLTWKVKKKSLLVKEQNKSFIYYV